MNKRFFIGAFLSAIFCLIVCGINADAESLTKENIKELLGKVDSGNSEEKTNAMEALAQSGDPKAVFPLVRKAYFENDADAKKVLIEYKVEAAIEPNILRFLDFTNMHYMHGYALKDLNKLTGQDWPADYRIWAEWWNEKCEKRTLELVKQKIKEDTPLGKNIIKLITDLGNEDEKINANAVSELIEIGGPAVEALIPALYDGRKRVRENAILVFYKKPDARATDALISTFDDWNVTMFIRAISILTRIGNGAVPNLLKAIDEEGSFYIRCGAAAVLGRIGDERTIEPLTNLLNDCSFRVREYAVSALGRFGNKGTQGLIKALENSNHNVRLKAAQELGQIKAEIAVPELIRVLKDEEEAVRGIAALALGKIGDKTAVPAIIKAMGIKETLNLGARISMIDTLGNLCDQSSIGDLIAISELTESPIELKAIAGALKKITGQDLGEDIGKWRLWWNKNK